jgi:hypothetical protein
MDKEQKDIRENRFEELHGQIELRRKQLLSKQTSMKLIAQQNRFLAGVKNDYDKYYAHIAAQRREQHEALALLQQYIGDLKNTDALTDTSIDDASNDQRMIVEEMKKIRGKLNALIG